MDATTPTPRPGIPAAFASVATVREAVVAIDADSCILMDANASMSVRDVAGLDETGEEPDVSRRLARSHEHAEAGAIEDLVRLRWETLAPLDSSLAL
jgi:hypothetical protein